MHQPWRGNLNVGTIPADGPRYLNQTQTRHKNAVVKDTRMDQPKASRSKRAADGPYTLTCRYTTHYGGYIVMGPFARKQGNA